MAKTAKARPKAQALVTRAPNGHGGPLKITVTPAGVKLARVMAEGGHPLYGIAAALGVDPSTLKKTRDRQPELQAALSAGHAALEFELVHTLLEAARGGAIAAAMFLLKTRCGYREQGPTDGGPDGRVLVNIMIPPPMSDEEFRAIIDGKCTVVPDGQPTLPGPRVER